MFRFVLLLCFLAGALILMPTAIQAAGTKSYPPENLRQLTYPERVRVIENEYYQQFGRRDLPDAQLEFYMDSVDSGWGFSRIRQDMATSFSGNNKVGWNSDSNWSPRNVICSSVNNQYVECPTPFNGRAVVGQQISKTRCQEGINWGQRRGMVWVNKGCRARFSEAIGGGGSDSGDNYGITSRVTCESTNKKFRECPTYFRGRPQLYRKFSKESCDEGPDWGYRAGSVWVRNGCRAEFYDSYSGNEIGWRDNNYSVTCAGEGSNYKTCAWDPRYGSPRILRQISKKSCVSGRTWGYDNGGLWVSDGCRATFAPR